MQSRRAEQAFGWKTLAITLRVRSFRRVVQFVVATLVAVACPQLSEAKCHATDFDAKQIQTIANEADSSGENLIALMQGGAGRASVVDGIALLGAANAAKGTGNEVAYFSVLLFIHSEMTAPADRKTVDDFIGMEASLIYRDLQSTGDGLTLIHPGGWGYGKDEIKGARDVIRKMQAMFSCAADDK